MRHAQRRLRRVLNATDPTASIIIPAEIMFVFNGTSSDLAQQFYQRYQAGDTLAKLRVSHKSLPRAIQERLAKYELKFENLHALLQRALLWDSGYVLDASADTEGSAMRLIQVYTANGTTMADIAVSYSEFTIGAGCLVANCSTSSSFASTTACEGTRLAPVMKCAVAEQLNATTRSSTPFWATGGDAKAIPELSVTPHLWTDSETSETYSVSTIHTIPVAQELSAGCASDAVGGSDSSSMIIPCSSHETLALSPSSSTQWSAPKQGTLVTVWLEHAQADKPGFNMYYTVLILVGVVAGLVLLIILACKGNSRFRKRQQRRAEAKMTISSNGVVALTSVHAITEADHENRNHDWANDALLFSNTLAGKRLRMGHLVFRKKIATTARSEVWIATYHGEHAAAKKIAHETSKLLENGGKISSTSRDARQFIPDCSCEIERLASLRHCNIARFYGVAWDSLESICVVSEYARKGNLQHRLDKEPLTRKQMRRILVGIARALQYLHADHSHSPLVHGDLCCKNILLSSHYEPKLIGLTTPEAACEALERESDSPISPSSVRTAPEVLHGAPVSPHSDIYAFGVLVSELLSHRATIRAMTGAEEHQPEMDKPECSGSMTRAVMV